ncbi:MAG: DMT family transporter [Alphaproteobacteria bacterium]|nr:DMT family transporter [Alphaproteobacteria bacterium]
MSLKQAAGHFLDRYWRSLPGNFRGAFWMLLSALAFVILQALTKQLGSKFDAVQIAFFRAAFGGLAVLPFILSRGKAAFQTDNLPYHVGRGLFGAMAIFLMVFAVIHMPLADATVLGFTRTLFLIVLAVLFLNERVRWRRWTATLVGFGGVVLMLRPGDETFQLAALAAVGASLCFASAHTCIKKCTTGRDHPMTVQSYYWIISTSVTLLPAILFWVTPNWDEFIFLLLTGILSGIAQILTVYALNAGEATFIGPFDFTRLLWAALFGALIFGEGLAATTIFGAIVIVGSNVYIARRQARDSRARSKAPD